MYIWGNELLVGGLRSPSASLVFYVLANYFSFNALLSSYPGLNQPPY